MQTDGKVMVVWLLMAAFTLTHAEVSQVKDKYTTRYDNVDLNDILTNKRLLNNYVKCLLGDGPCTADGAELKKSLPDAIQTECSKCSDKQKEGSNQVIHFLIDNEPTVWAKLEAQYDPEGEYKKRYLEQKEVKIAPAPTEPTEVNN